MTNEVPRLSASIAHKMTTESALAGWSAHRLLGNYKKPATPSQIEGRKWHAAILGTAHDIQVCEVENFKAAAGKALKAAALAADKIPVSRPDYDAMLVHTPHILESLAGRGIFFDGVVEKRHEWEQHTETGEIVNCSGYIDHSKGYVIHELKTGKSSTPAHEAMNLISRNHAIIQDAAYRSAVAARWDEVTTEDELDFMYVFVQTQPPYSVTPCRMSGAFREISHLRWRRAIEAWHTCISNGTEKENWPDVTEGIVSIAPPGWMLSQEIELEAQE
jgi:hypothetical protein